MITIEKEYNIFKYIAYLYYESIINILRSNFHQNGYVCTKSYQDSLLDIFKKRYKLENSSEINNKFESMKNNILSCSNSDFIEQVLKDFAKFIRYTEKCFMYRNDESAILYSEEIKNIINLYYKRDDYKVKISFEQSEIPNIKKTNLLESFITGNQLINNNLEFINIEIVREYGKRMTNVFKFVSGENPKFNDSSDKILFDRFRKDITDSIFFVFDNILNSFIYDYTKIENTTDWKEVIKYGIRIW